jgi:hypothetical protein
VRWAFARICARCASHSARSASVSFFFAIAFSRQLLDPIQRRCNDFRALDVVCVAHRLRSPGCIDIRRNPTATVSS